MPLEIKKEEKETSRKLIRRFSQRMRRSGILKKARASQFRERPLSKTKKKRQALRRIKMKEKYERE